MLAKVFKVNYIPENWDNQRVLIEGITEWEEITEEDARILENLGMGYMVVRQLNQEKIRLTIENLKAPIIKREQEKNKQKSGNKWHWNVS
jgi:hypothetical protein